MKKYWKAYKAYEKSYNAKLAEANKLAEKFGKEHRVGVLVHTLLLYMALYAILGGLYLGIVYGVPYLLDKVNWKKKEKFYNEMSKDIEETVSEQLATE